MLNMLWVQGQTTGQGHSDNREKKANEIGGVRCREEEGIIGAEKFSIIVDDCCVLVRDIKC